MLLKKEGIAFLIISEEIVILPNFKRVLGEKEKVHYQLTTTTFQIKVFRKKEHKVLLDQIPTSKTSGRPLHDTQAIARAYAITHANQEKGG